MSKEYDVGYFEGVRNSWMALISKTKPEDGKASLEDYIAWISNELAEARKLRDEWDE